MQFKQTEQSRVKHFVLSTRSVCGSYRKVERGKEKKSVVATDVMNRGFAPKRRPRNCLIEVCVGSWLLVGCKSTVYGWIER